MNGILDPLPVLDAIYRFELDEPGWLRALVETVWPMLVDSPGIAACTYDSSLDRPSVDSFVTAGAFRASEIARALASTSGSSRAAYSQLGGATLFELNGIDPGARGVWVAAILPNAGDPEWKICDRWQVLAQHLARAIGLRRHLHAAQRRSTETLTGREREVLAFAAAGNTTKLIAFELGIADATVRVLLKRAAKKLGARNRTDAIARFAGGAPARVM